jgi:hypothetical protein
LVSGSGGGAEFVFVPALLDAFALGRFDRVVLVIERVLRDDRDELVRQRVDDFARERAREAFFGLRDRAPAGSAAGVFLLLVLLVVAASPAFSVRFVFERRWVRLVGAGL